MSVNDFFEANPGLSREQAENIEVLENPESLDAKALFDSKNLGCNFVCDRDEGRYSVLKSTMFSCVIVSTVRNGRISTRMTFQIGQGHELKLLQNNDGLNYDGYVCC
jgi:hypothetical protein